MYITTPNDYITMKKQKLILLYGIALSICCLSCNHLASRNNDSWIDSTINYCEQQAHKTLISIPDINKIPNSIDADSTNWTYTSIGTWTCGFWPGILWYLYENTKDNSWKEAAEKVTEQIVPLGYQKARTHDSGFIMMCSLGNGYRLTGNTTYKESLLHAADSLATLYNPIVGTLLSWPNMVQKENWPHNTIIDNMMNLELLFWAAKNGGSHKLYDIAFRHAQTTMKYQFRKDYSCYHVAVYDTLDGHFIKGVTHQGLSDNSMWARGQAWAIYGYTMAYRETKNAEFLNFAQKVTNVFLQRLPADHIPYWDFDAQEISLSEPRDASAAAITAAALLELSTYVTNTENARYYRTEAIAMLRKLSSSDYQSRNSKNSFLLHSVGHMHRNWEVDASICYADYYYLEALTRLKRLKENEKILTNL